MRALVTGATGFVGGRLLELVQRPVVLSRDPQRARRRLPNAEVFNWDPLAGLPPPEAFDGVEAVFHLAGESVGQGRWTAAKKQRIRDSRVIGTANLVKRLAALEQRPRVLISASAVGYYGSRGDELLDETAAPGDDFLARVCGEWEQAAGEATAAGIRVVTPRLGIVLGAGGGALARMLLPFRLGLGGRLGDGRQWMPWVHLEDVAGLMLFAAEHDAVSGAVNAVSPEPVTNREFTRVLAGVLHRPAVLPAPALGLRLMLGEFADVLLGSQRVVPRAAEKAGYVFRFTDLQAALRDILGMEPTGQAQAQEKVKG